MKNKKQEDINHSRGTVRQLQLFIKINLQELTT